MAPGMEMGTGNQILGRGRGNKSPTLGMGTGTLDRIRDSVLGTGTGSNDEINYGPLLAAHASYVMDGEAESPSQRSRWIKEGKNESSDKDGGLNPHRCAGNREGRPKSQLSAGDGSGDEEPNIQHNSGDGNGGKGRGNEFPSLRWILIRSKRCKVQVTY
eukprot:CAMPEP_0171322782 /NCGR_PEP_ID=MMETSP0816-20121228/115172_1 /TAXON_ID=420281 /ORGANISM="Proboscia inermis, Strain CCAP1064/1" /LENGTH=158 /DNA_ID=CAMNT_0011821341 /DNA_START=1249 /DNA_END=1726 /DNA_ORIENTATION=-